MTVSTQVSYSQTGDQLIEDAFQLLTINGIGENISSTDMNFARRILNKMLKFWETKQIHLWTQTEAVLFFEQYKGEYALGNGAKAANRADTVTTKLTAEAIQGATVINVLSTSGIAANQAIGVVLSDKSLFWTTVATVDSSTQLTLNAALPLKAWQSALVYSYTKLINKPLRLGAYPRMVQGFDGGSYSTLSEWQVMLQSYDNYMMLPNKTINGNLPVQVMFNPLVDYSNLFMFPRPSDCSYRMYFTYYRRMADILNTSDTFDLPDEWQECITYQLAMRLARPFGRAQALADIQPLAAQMLDALEAWDVETVSVEFHACNYQ